MIYETDFQKQIENAFLTYGASIAQQRAIADVRDGLKIGLRQGLYAQYTNKITHKDKFQKAIKSVSAATAQSYVHGDVAMYDTLIRAARPWSYRYPLEETQGSAGDQTDPDSQSAMRYVEMRASELADVLFAGLKKDAVHEWYWNYDDSEQIPSVFPSIGYWNIVNGCSGIAVAMATSVPCFNLKEVNEALVKIIRDPNVSFDNIYCAPDFPTGCTIINADAVKESLRNGKGESIRMRAKLTYFPEQNMIQATNLPYGVFTNTVIDQLASLTEENPSYGIERVTDHTKKEADIRIYLSKGINVKKMIDKLYKDTALENYFSVNMILLDKGRFPKVFGWRAACDAYIAHIKECKRNEIQFDLDKALARKNIVDGLIKAYSILDEVIALIRNSDNPSQASIKLINTYQFNEEQAKAILAMKLSSLTRLDIVKLENEAEELIQNIQSLTHLLNEPSAFDEELITILHDVSNKFGDERRTQIINLVEANNIEEITEEEIAVVISANDTMRIYPKNDKRMKLKSTKIKDIIYTTNLSSLNVITENGRFYNIVLSNYHYEKDYPIIENERCVFISTANVFNSYSNIITISTNGYIKKSSTTEYTSRAKKGVPACKLTDNDKLVCAYLSSDDEDKILIINNENYYNYYPIKDINITGRLTAGVKAIKLNDNNIIYDACIIRKALQYDTIQLNNMTIKVNELVLTTRGSRGKKIEV